MDKEYIFYDYVDADGTGRNVIKDWLDGDGRLAYGHFTRMIPILEATPPGSGTWGDPYVEVMVNKRHRNWDGFIALRKKKDVHRIIGKRIGRAVYLVATGIHKGNQRYKTDVSPRTASTRVDQMIAGAKYRSEHEY